MSFFSSTPSSLKRGSSKISGSLETKENKERKYKSRWQVETGPFYCNNDPLVPRCDQKIFDDQGSLVSPVKPEFFPSWTEWENARGLHDTFQDRETCDIKCKEYMKILAPVPRGILPLI